MNLNYSFAIRVDEKGNMSPFFNVWPPQIGKYLNHLAWNINLESVDLDISLINKIISGDQIEGYVSDKGDCIFKVMQSTTELIEFYEEFDPVKISTADFLNLIKDLYNFLRMYYEGKIPFIIPMNLRSEYKIVNT